MEKCFMEKYTVIVHQSKYSTINYFEKAEYKKH